MIRKFPGRSFLKPLVVGAAVMFVGCGGDDEVDPTPPPPMDDYFRVTSMRVGDSDEGVDVDGSGDVDNNIEVALEGINTAILAQVSAALDESDLPETCEPPSQVCQETVLDAVSAALEQVLSVDSLSTALNQPIQEGQINYIVEFKENGAAVDLHWHTGEFRNTAWATVSELGTQPGTLDTTSGAGSFGPGNLTLRFYFEVTNPQSGTTETIDIPITLYNGRTEVTGYNDQKLTDFVSGGAISTEDLVSLVEQILTNINENLPEQVPPLDVDAIVATIAGAIAPYADVNIDSDPDNEGFSIGLIASADQIAVAAQ